MVATRRDPQKVNIIRGTTAEMPLASAAGVLIGDEFHDETTGIKYKRSVSAAGAAQWVIFGFDGGSLSGKYWVSQTGLSPYSTITSAIAAAVADAIPSAEICIMPGTYAESFTLPGGMALVGLMDGQGGLVVINGTVAFAPTAGPTAGVIRGVTIVSGAGDRPVSFAGAANASLLLEEVNLSSNNMAAVDVTNTHANSLLRIFRSRITSSVSPLLDNALVQFAAASTMEFEIANCTIQCASPTDRAIRYDGVPVAVLNIFRCTVSGGIQLATGNARIEFCFLSSTAPADSVSWDVGLVRAFACTIDAKGGAKPFNVIGVGAAGTLVAQGCNFETGRLIGVDVVQSSVDFAANSRFNTTVNNVAPGLTNPCDLVLCNAILGAVATTLPDSRSFPANAQIEFYHLVGANNWSVAPAAGDTLLDTTGTSVASIALNAVGDSAILALDSITRTWVQIK